MSEVKYIECVYVVIFNNGDSLEIKANIKDDYNFTRKKQFFKEILENHRNVREVRI